MKRTARDLIPNTPRNLRLDAAMSPGQVADLMGISLPAQNRLERQPGNPTAYTLGLFFAAVGRDDLAQIMANLLGPARRADILHVQQQRLERWGPPLAVPPAQTAVPEPQPLASWRKKPPTRENPYCPGDGRSCPSQNPSGSAGCDHVWCRSCAEWSTHSGGSNYRCGCYVNDRFPG